METRVEQKITIQSDGDPIDHDRALAEAIQVRCFILTLRVAVLNASFTGGNSHEPGYDRRED